MATVFSRTHMDGVLRASDIGKEVVLNGWAAKQRSLGSLIFVDIRDKTGITQVTFNEDVPADVLEKAKSLSREYCIGIKGVVRERSSKNPNLPTGDIEVFADDITIYSKMLPERSRTLQRTTLRLLVLPLYLSSKMPCSALSLSVSAYWEKVKPLAALAFSI